jgi:hypothetical protein
MNHRLGQPMADRDAVTRRFDVVVDQWVCVQIRLLLLLRPPAQQCRYG